jgi:hypothetical protein
LQREAEGNCPPQRQVIAWERRIGNMRDEGVTQADHERPRMQPSQADDLVDEQAQQSRCASNEHRLAGGLAAAKPADADQDWNSPDELFGQEDGQRQRQALGAQVR